MKRVITLIGFIFLYSQICYGVSLWEPGGSLFTELKERNVGDVITIIVTERADAQHKSNDEFDKEVKLD
ncbi:MAG: flagellar basal body L-ring protein FlgH, partial [Candidatus Hydrogenedentota bacterium]